MLRGANIQWGYAGLINFGIMGVGGHYPAYAPNPDQYCKLNDTAACYDSQKLIIDYVAYYQKNTN